MTDGMDNSCREGSWSVGSKKELHLEDRMTETDGVSEDILKRGQAVHRGQKSLSA